MSLWIVCDGKSESTLQLLQTFKDGTYPNEDYNAEVMAQYDAHGVFEGRSFTIIECEQQNDNRYANVLLQSRKEAKAEPEEKKVFQASSNTSYEVALVRIELPSTKRKSCDERIKVLAKFRGDDPLYCAILSSPTSVSLFSESHFKSDDPTAPQPPHAPQAEPSASSSGAVAKVAKTEPEYGRAVDKAGLHPAYSWAQTSDTVTIAFSLPAHLTKQDIRVHFSPPHGLSLLISAEADLLQSEPKIVELFGDGSAPTSGSHELNLAIAMREGKYEKRTFWAPIDVNGSVWTWEKAKSQVDKTKDIGLLTLHLEKKDEGTKWMHVFSQSDGPGGTLTDDVLETTDPSELLKALQGLEKYTVQEGEEAGPGADRTDFLGEQPSLLKDGPEEEDATVGRPLRMTYFYARHDGGIALMRYSSTTPSTMLCQPLTTDGTRDLDRCIAIKHDFDGILLSFDWNEADHIDTIPALSYVLASKREAHRCYSVRTGTTSVSRGHAFAFEGPTPGLTAKPGDAAGNLFYYRGPEREARTSKQGAYGRSGVIKLGLSMTPSVTDVVSVTTNGSPTIACLTSTQLLLLPNILK